jgi:hypothetical protein
VRSDRAVVWTEDGLPWQLWALGLFFWPSNLSVIFATKATKAIFARRKVANRTDNEGKLRMIGMLGSCPTGSSSRYTDIPNILPGVNPLAGGMFFLARSLHAPWRVAKRRDRSVWGIGAEPGTP